MTPSFSLAFLGDALFHAFLPITTYVLTTIGTWMLSMKGSTVGTLGEDFVTVARARGLTDWRITTAYVGRNAALPLFTQLAIAIGFVVGGFGVHGSPRRFAIGVGGRHVWRRCVASRCRRY